MEHYEECDFVDACAVLLITISPSICYIILIGSFDYYLFIFPHCFSVLIFRSCYLILVLFTLALAPWFSCITQIIPYNKKYYFMPY